MLITFAELLDAVIMSGALGFIFMKFVKKPRQYDVVETLIPKRGFDWGNFWFAISIIAPAIVLHEMAHKFVAMAFGLSATFQASYTGLLIGIVLSVMNFPFLFFVPGYVVLGSGGTAFQNMLIAFAGPAMHLLFFLGAYIALHSKKKFSNNTTAILMLTKKINLFLFIFNILPIPGFDGFHVFRNLLAMVVG